MPSTGGSAGTDEAEGWDSAEVETASKRRRSDTGNGPDEDQTNGAGDGVGDGNGNGEGNGEGEALVCEACGVICDDLKAWLDTQFHARLAAPWTCLVVVIIAVPFAAPSGRRNLFFGVAGSIGLAFIFFVVQRVGFAMGQNGIVPAWLGAWLPNLVFSVTGLILTARVR
jgi:hypothetical protein